MSDVYYARILQAVTALPWAILPEKLAVIQDLLAFRAAGGRLTESEVRERLEAAGAGDVRARTERTVRAGEGAVAVLPLVGTIIPRADLLTESSGAVSVQRFQRAFRAAMADPDVASIVIDVDSPGGQVDMVPELAAEVLAARGVKPVTAVANTLAASAAYWIASAADELVVTPSGEVGSIGVLTMHADYSGMLEREGVAVTYIHAGDYKVEGNPYEPLGDEARAAIQERVDAYYEMFVEAVARGRGVTVATVKNEFGQGRVVGAETAVARNMADRVGTLDGVIQEHLASSQQQRQTRADYDRRLRRMRLHQK